MKEMFLLFKQVDACCVGNNSFPGDFGNDV